MAEGKEWSKKFTEKYIWKDKRANLESHPFGKFKSFLRGQFSGFLSPFRPVILLCPLSTSLVNFSQDPFLGCPCPPQPRWISKWRLLGGARLIMAWNYPLTFDSKEPLCRVSLVLKRVGKENPLILYSNRVLPLFVLAMIINLRCSQETKTGCLPYFCCYFPLRG